MNPFFSVIIPTHNRANMLRQAIQSVIDQTVDEWEVLIIDDGSTDNTKEVIQDFKDSRIHYYYQENKERSAARNLGIQKAVGMYVCFLDDDDYFLGNHFEVLQKEIHKEAYPIGIFRTGMITKHGDKEKRSPFYSHKSSSHPIPFFLENMVGIHTLCYHRNILSKYTYDERWHHFQDTHLLIRCLLEFPFFQIHEHTAIYMRYPEMGSISIFRLDNAETRTENNVNAIKDLFYQGDVELLKYVPAKMESYLVAKKYLDHANGSLYVGRRKLARKYLNKSLQVGRRKNLFIAYVKFLIRYVLSFFK
jgi:glycosyltransferase involved in cell wall biosynthesis